MAIPRSFDAIIIGAGAAGMFCAALAGQRGRRVLLIDHSPEPGRKILISGGGSKLNGLVEFLAKQFEIPVEVFDPFRKIRVDSRGFDPEYMREIVPEMAIAVGLALRGVDAR